jgi:hypothetical protein
MLQAFEKYMVWLCSGQNPQNGIAFKSHTAPVWGSTLKWSCQRDPLGDCDPTNSENHAYQAYTTNVHTWKPKMYFRKRGKGAEGWRGKGARVEGQIKNMGRVEVPETLGQSEWPRI